jgi:hypothetical protein
MAQIKILDKEKDYLLSVNPYKFVDSLNSASIFYELLSFDKLNLSKSIDRILTCDKTGIGKTEYKRVYPYNNITLLGIYNAILNLITSNLYEGLAFRHYIIYKKPDKEYSLKNFSIEIKCVNYKDKSFYDSTKQNVNLYQDYNYIFGSSEWYSANFESIADGVKMSYGLSTFEHQIVISSEKMESDFLSKMLILYEDFVDNIPI